MIVDMWLVPCVTGPDVFAMRKPSPEMSPEISVGFNYTGLKKRTAPCYALEYVR